MKELRNHRRYERVLSVSWWVLFCVPFVIYAVYAVRYAVNVPILDDYNMVLRFLNSFLENATLGGKAGIIWQQAVESRVLFLRLEALLEYWLLHRADFRWLLVLGDIANCAICALLAAYGLRRGIGKVGLLAIPYVILAPVSLDGIGWTAGQMHIWVTLFSLLFLWALDADKLVLSCALYVLSILTLASGLALFPTGLLFLAWKRHWRQLWVFGGVSLLVTAAYFVNYSTPPHPLLHPSSNPLESFAAFFAFFGSPLYSYGAAVVAGILIAALLAAATVWSYRNDDFLLLVGLWLLINAFAVGFGRRTGVPAAAEAAPQRYAPYGLVALALAVLWGLRRIEELPSLARRLSVLIVIVTVAGYSIAIYTNFASGRFEQGRDWKIAGINELAKYGRPDLLSFPDPRELAAGILFKSQQNGVYAYQAVGSELAHPVVWLTEAPEVNATVGGYIDSYSAGTVAGWAVISGTRSAASSTFVLLRNANRVAKLNTYKVKRPDVSNALGAGMYEDSGYIALTSAYDLPQGIYQIGLMVQSGSLIGIQWTNFSLELR